MTDHDNDPQPDDAETLLLRGKPSIGIQSADAPTREVIERIATQRLAARRAVEREQATVDSESVAQLRFRIEKAAMPSTRVVSRFGPRWSLGLAAGFAGILVGTLLSSSLPPLFGTRPGFGDEQLVLSVGEYSRDAAAVTTWPVAVRDTVATTSELVEQLARDHVSFRVFRGSIGNQQRVEFTIPQTPSTDLAAILHGLGVQQAAGEVDIVLRQAP
jgi:hypothetical protein